VLTKDGTNVAFPAFQEETNRLDALFRSRIGAFEILGTFREPDGSTVTLYKRTFKRTFKRTATPAAAPGRSDPRTRRAHLVPLS
jgi:hypothetical protein